MKTQVVLKVPSHRNIVSVDEVNEDLYYVVKSDAAIGIITRQHYDDGPFLCKSTDEFTRGNGWTFVCGCKTLTQVVTKAINLKFTVYQFDTAKEMFQWVADNCE